MVPSAVSELIKRRRLLGFVEKPSRRRTTARALKPGLVDSVHLAGVPYAA
jgi:hypothetical protein